MTNFMKEINFNKRSILQQSSFPSMFSVFI